MINTAVKDKDRIAWECLDTNTITNDHLQGSEIQLTLVAKYWHFSDYAQIFKQLNIIHVYMYT